MVEVQKLLDAALAKAFAVCDEHSEELKKLVAEIDEHETLLEPDFKRIFNMTYGETEAEPKALPSAGV
jgi:ATP-dependent Zn protease